MKLRTTKFQVRSIILTTFRQGVIDWFLYDVNFGVALNELSSFDFLKISIHKVPSHCEFTVVFPYIFDTHCVDCKE